MKKMLCMLMALLMVCLSAAACAETIELKVWSAQPDQALLEELCNAFAAEHPEIVRELVDIIRKEHTDNPMFKVTLPY